MAKISVIGGVSDVNAPAPVVARDSGPEPIRVEDILAGAIKLALPVDEPDEADEPAQAKHRRRTA